MSIIDAKRSMAELGTKAKAVQDDTSLTNAEKMVRLDALTADLKGYSDTIAVHEHAARLMAGGEAAPEVKAESNVETRSFGA